MLIVLHAGCSANFTYISSVNGCYKVLVTREMNWYAAARACQSLHEDAHLLVINDAREQSAVANSQFSFLVFTRTNAMLLRDWVDNAIVCRLSLCLSGVTLMYADHNSWAISKRIARIIS